MNAPEQPTEPAEPTHPIDRNIETVVERFAREDGTTPTKWRDGAVRNVVAQRLTGEAAWHHTEYISIHGFHDDDTPIQPWEVPS